MAASLWWDTVGRPIESHPPLPGSAEADVVVVGAGYSGLWTAYYLAGLDPSLRIVVLEREHVGFGASGRNGGWCIGELAAHHATLARAAGHDAAVAQMRAMFDTVAEIATVVAAESIECDLARGGTIRVARNGAQLARQRDEVAGMRQLGFDDADVRLLGAGEASEMLGASDVSGGIFQAHSAALHPAKLALGLADAVVRRGVQIHEGTAVTALAPGSVTTTHGVVRAATVVLATEAYTGDLPGRGRDLVPLYSLMIATEPLPDSVWASIGLANRQTFADDRHLVIYGQRTGDGRLAFGGRGAPYRFGSRTDATIEHGCATHDALAATLRELLPQIGAAAITHRWGGVLGVPRDWFPSVGFDAHTRLGRLGGYVGEGVAAANLAGRTLAELIVGVDSPRTALAWVNHRSRRWEPEPLRWLEINAALRATTLADRIEHRTNRQSRLATLVQRQLHGKS